MAKLIINPTSPSRREASLPRARLSVGRDPSNDLVLPDAMVSRHHAVIEYRGNQYVLRDCGSSNGSLVNGDRVDERGLRDGDIVAIGASRLLFRDDVENADATGKVVHHPSSRRLRCSHCDTSYFGSDAYCRNCGAAVEPPSPRVACPHCGTAMAAAVRFCAACGRAMADGGSDEVHFAPAGGSGSVAAALPSWTAAPARASAPPMPTVLSRHLREAAPTPAEPTVRVVAGLFDAAVVATLQLSAVAPLILRWWSHDPAVDVTFGEVLTSVLWVIGVGALGAFYSIYFTGRHGATPGKLLLGLSVVAEDGLYPIGLPRAALRFVGQCFSALLFGIGFLMILVDGHALHDRIARTIVTRTRPR